MPKYNRNYKASHNAWLSTLLSFARGENTLYGKSKRGGPGIVVVLEIIGT